MQKKRKFTFAKPIKQAYKTIASNREMKNSRDRRKIIVAKNIASN